MIKPEVFLTILGMAVVTYLTRAGGLWMMSRVRLSRRVEALLRNLPGAVMVAIVAPGIVTGGPSVVIASGFTVLTAARTGNLLVALVCGVGTVWLLRTLTGLS